MKAPASSEVTRGCQGGATPTVTDSTLTVLQQSARVELNKLHLDQSDHLVNLLHLAPTAHLTHQAQVQIFII